KWLCRRRRGQVGGLETMTMIESTPRSLLGDPEARLWASRPSRGRFLKALAATAMAGGGLSLLAPEADAAVSGAKKLDKVLNFYNWSQWEGPTEIARFEKKYGVKVRLDIYPSNDVLYAKLKAGGLTQYDVIVPTSYLVTRMIKQGMLKKLD